MDEHLSEAAQVEVLTLTSKDHKSKDHKEALASFRQKRVPKYKGK